MRNPHNPPVGWYLALMMLALIAFVLLGWAEARAAAEAAAATAAAVAIDSRWVFIGAALAAGLATLGAGFAVARVGTAAVGALAEKPELFGRLLIFIGLAEGIAIYGLIVAILMLNRLG
jgi:V/A-type H+-transporting ATPase subunit K